MPFGLNHLRTAVLFATARAEAVTVTPVAGLAFACMAVRYDRSADPAFEEDTFRRVRFEIAAADFPTEPGKGDIIHDGSQQWVVAEIEHRPEVSSWLLSVEKSSG